MNVIVKNIVLPYRRPQEEALGEAVKRLSRAGVKAKGKGIYRRSVDARKKNDIKFVYSVVCESENAPERALEKANAVVELETEIKAVCGGEKLSARPVVCGFGPAGMFAALLLAENGYMPLVIERGSDVERRRREIERFYQTGVLNTECNVQFGAGGAGTFSDGKLMTRINDPRCRYILERFVEFGAQEDILVKAKPHVGTDRLLGVVANIAERIESLGGRILYDTRLDGIKRVGTDAEAVHTTAGDIDCGCLVLATGHSARDTYEYLMKNGFQIAPKSFSVGVRIEHLRSDIEKALYGENAGDPLLGAAEYTLSAHMGDTGVYSFCMCPGGQVMAAASEEGGVVTNGMSEYARDGVNSNAALAVSMEERDPMAVQRMIERAAFAAGGGEYRAPVQTVGDFLEGKAVSEPSRVMPTYMGGERYRVCDLEKVLPHKVCEALRFGIGRFGRTISGFDAQDAVLTGAETRTSAPYRILRCEDLTALGSGNIYPCGEGAGYAGGITSASLDGVKTALAIMKKYRSISEN